MSEWAIRFTVDLVMWTGWIVLVVGGVAFAAALVGLGLNYGWRKYRDAIAYSELCDAVRAWKARKPRAQGESE